MGFPIYILGEGKPRTISQNIKFLLLFGFTYYLLLGKKKNPSYVCEHTEMIFKNQVSSNLQDCAYVWLLQVHPSPSAPVVSALFVLGMPQYIV